MAAAAEAAALSARPNGDQLRERHVFGLPGGPYVVVDRPPVSGAVALVTTHAHAGEHIGWWNGDPGLSGLVVWWAGSLSAT